MTDVIATLATRLTEEKGLAPVSTLDLEPDVPPPALPFLGVREYWGSILTVGLAEGGGLGRAEVQRLAAGFYGFTHSLLPLAGRLRVGLATTRLGSFGLLLFVFRAACPPDLLAAVRSSKHGSAFRKDYAVSWAAELPAGRVHTHRWFPLAMFPGRRYLEQVIAGP